MDLSLPQLIAVYAIPVILAITLHEAAHAYVAWRLGDPTARAQGRVTANPFKHIDPIGTLLVPGLILLAGKLAGGGIAFFGWAKPVPVVTGNLRSPRRDMGLVAAAGPLANVLMAIAWGLGLKLATMSALGASVGEYVARVCMAGVVVNLVLAVLNLIPVPPLDGGRIVISLLPSAMAAAVSRLEPYGLMILLALLATGVLGRVIYPLVDMGVGAVFALFGM